MTYDPNIGRWLEIDPIGFDGGDADLYRMEGNNPVNEVDPSGEDVDLLFLPRMVWNTGKAFLKGEEPPPEFRAMGAVSGVLMEHSDLPDVTKLYKTPARAFWEWVAKSQMQDKGLGFSALLLRHSLQDCPKKLVLPEKHIGTMKMRSSKEYKDLIADIVKNAPVGKSSGTYKPGIQFNGGHGVDSEDLFAAVHNAEVEYSITKIDSDNYEIQIKIKDRYNFERNLKGYYGKNILVWTGANTAWFSQYPMVINGFDWETDWLTENKGVVKK